MGERISRENIVDTDLDAINQPGAVPGSTTAGVDANARPNPTGDGTAVVALTASSPAVVDDGDATVESSGTADRNTDAQGASQGYTVDALMRKNRDQLDAIALETGLGDTGAYDTKRDLATAIIALQGGDGAPVTTETVDTDIDQADAEQSDDDDHPHRDQWITIRGLAKEGYVALMDVDPRHPGGQLWVTGTNEAQAFPTGNVTRAINYRLVEQVTT